MNRIIVIIIIYRRGRLTCESLCSSRRRSLGSCRCWSTRAKRPRTTAAGPWTRSSRRRTRTASWRRRTAASRRWTRPWRYPTSWPPSSRGTACSASGWARSFSAAGALACSPLRRRPTRTWSCRRPGVSAASAPSDLLRCPRHCRFRHRFRRRRRRHRNHHRTTGWTTALWCLTFGTGSAWRPPCRSCSTWTPWPAVARKTIWWTRISGTRCCWWTGTCCWAPVRCGPAATRWWPGSWWHRCTPTRRRSAGTPVSGSSWSGTWTGRWWPSTGPAISRKGSVWTPCWTARPATATRRTRLCRTSSSGRALPGPRSPASPPARPGSRRTPATWWSSWWPCAGTAPGPRRWLPDSCRTRLPCRTPSTPPTAETGRRKSTDKPPTPPCPTCRRIRRPCRLSTPPLSSSSWSRLFAEVCLSELDVTNR